MVTPFLTWPWASHLPQAKIVSDSATSQTMLQIFWTFYILKVFQIASLIEKVLLILPDGVVELHQKGSATNKATPSCLNSTIQDANKQDVKIAPAEQCSIMHV